MSGFTQFVLPAASLWQRELIRFFRQRSRVMGALGTPLLFWLLLGMGMGGDFRSYFFPGAVVQVLLFTAIFSTISIIEDRREGFMQSVLVAPISRGSLVMGKLLGGATLATLQGLLFMLFAPLAGLEVTPLSGIASALVMFLVAFGLTGLGFVIAWPMQTTQGFHAIMNLFLLPMWLLSGALFAPATAAVGMRYIMFANPLTYGLSLLRHVMSGSAANAQAGMPGFGISLAVTLVFTAVMFAGAWYMVYRRRGVPY